VKRKLRYRRSSEVITTKQSQLLREIRLRVGLSIREVGRRLGKSESCLRHIETGRMNFPQTEDLKLILNIYEVSTHQFKIRLKSYERNSGVSECIELLKKLENTKKYLELLLSRP